MGIMKGPEWACGPCPHLSSGLWVCVALTAGKKQMSKQNTVRPGKEPTCPGLPRSDGHSRRGGRHLPWEPPEGFSLHHCHSTRLPVARHW